MATARAPASAEPGIPGVPPFECLQQGPAHLHAELQRVSKITRCVTVQHQHLLQRAADRSQELRDHPDPAETPTYRDRDDGLR